MKRVACSSEDLRGKNAKTFHFFSSKLKIEQIAHLLECSAEGTPWLPGRPSSLSRQTSDILLCNGHRFTINRF